jgi:hypothetical protein
VDGRPVGDVEAGTARLTPRGSTAPPPDQARWVSR